MLERETTMLSLLDSFSDDIKKDWPLTLLRVEAFFIASLSPKVKKEDIRWERKESFY